MKGRALEELRGERKERGSLEDIGMYWGKLRGKETGGEGKAGEGLEYNDILNVFMEHGTGST